MIRNEPRVLRRATTDKIGIGKVKIMTLDNPSHHFSPRCSLTCDAPMDEVSVSVVDWTVTEQANAVAQLVNEYARDAFGNGEPLDDAIVAKLPALLAKVPGAFSVIATTVVDGVSIPVGVINCFQGFSTFKCAPLINVHDVFVLPSQRGKRIATKMMTLVEQVAKHRGCCKLTLEVLSNNAVAMGTYRKFGFDNYELAGGQALFFHKQLVV